MPTTRKTLRIFVSSPGDVHEERDKARSVIDSLQRQYTDAILKPVLWQDLALPATASFQETIDFILQKEPIDIAVFILWSRLGSPVGPAITRADGTQYRSGTEREFDLMLTIFEQSGKQRPVILAYTRNDDYGFRQSLADCPVSGLEGLIAQRKLAESFIREQFKDGDGINVRAYHSYREPVSFAQRLHTHLRQVLDELLGGDVAPRWLNEPYRGLEVFDIEHASIFQGRDEETCDVLQRLRDQEQAGCAFAVIVGASGSGKSSLARAGVAAALMHHAYDDRVKEWRVVTFFPSLNGSDLNRSLTRALAEQLPEIRSSATALDDIANGLAKDAPLTVKLSIEPAFARAAESAKGAVRILLLVDQLEELWTAPRITAEDRKQFLEVLEALARGGHIAVLATLRSDFYPHAQRIPAFLRLKGERGHFDLVPPGAAALHRLITEPARLAGLKFEREDQTGRTLDQLILEDASRDPAALPLLQYALSELYHQRDDAMHTLTFAAYQSMNGVEGALGKRAAETFQSLPPDVRASLTEILPLLVTIDIAGEQTAVRRRAPLAELTATPVRRMLTESLIAARFLTTDRQDDTPVVSLAHEALLRRWNELAEWVSTNREHLRLRARVEQTQQRWEQQNREASLLLPPGLPLEEGRQLLREAPSLLSGTGNSIAEFIRVSIAREEFRILQTRRRRNAVTLALSVLTILALVGGAIAWLKQQDATVQRDDAIEARKQADRQTGIARLSGTRALEAEKRTEKYLKLSFTILLGLDFPVPGTHNSLLDISDVEFNTPKGADKTSLYRIMDLAVGRSVPEGQQISDEAMAEFLMGLELLNTRDSEGARPHVTQAADAHPEIRLFGFVASLVAANLKDYDESIRRARMLVERFPDDAELIFHLADLLDAQRIEEPQLAGTLIPEIQQLCQEARQLLPAYVPPRLLLAEIAEVGSAEELKAAEAELRVLLEFSPDRRVRRALVSNLRVQQRFQDAFKENQSLISPASPSPNDLLVNAKLLRSIGRPQEAIVAFSQFEALRLALPDSSPWKEQVSHLNDWGVALSELHQFKEALEILQRIRPDYEGHPVYESNVAMALLGDEKYDRAIAIWKDIAAAADADDRVSANVYLIQGLICAGKSDEAMDVVRNAKYAAPDQPQRFDYLFVGLSQLAASISGTVPILATEWNAMEARPESADEKWDYFYLQRFSNTLVGDSATAFAKQLAAIQQKVPRKTFE